MYMITPIMHRMSDPHTYSNCLQISANSENETDPAKRMAKGVVVITPDVDISYTNSSR